MERFSWWYARMTETDALGDVRIEPLLELLVRWAGETATEFEYRMLKLEALLQRLEKADANPGIGLGEARAWAQSEMAANPAMLKEVLELLDRAAPKPGQGNRK